MAHAENAIADQYAAAMMSGNHARNFLTNDNAAESSGHIGGINSMNGMSQSYRNVGVANIVSTPGSQGGQVYDKMRNSYQNPNGSYDMN